MTIHDTHMSLAQHTAVHTWSYNLVIFAMYTLESILGQTVIPKTALLEHLPKNAGAMFPLFFTHDIPHCQPTTHTCTHTHAHTSSPPFAVRHAPPPARRFSAAAP